MSAHQGAQSVLGAFGAGDHFSPPSRRCSSRSTAVRMNSDRLPSPASALIRASTDAGQRIGTMTVGSPSPPSGFLPIEEALAVQGFSIKSYIPACNRLYD